MPDHSEEIEHVAFNPRALGLGGQSALERVASDWQRGGWALLRVVPHHPYESVAVFTRKAEVTAGNALLREALRLACEDGWDDGQWAMRRYLKMAQASLSGSRTEEDDSDG